MWQLIKGKKAQSAVEIAVLASIIILAFSSLINLTEKINRTQLHMQNVFREQLSAAYASGASKGTGISSYRAPNIIDPYAPGELVFLKSSGGKVLWSSHGGEIEADISKGDKEDLEKIEYEKTFRRIEKPGSLPETQWTVVSYNVATGSVATRSGPNEK